MRLKSLHIHRGYSDDAPLRGELTFRAEEGEHELKMKLDEQLSIDIVNLCAEAIARAGQAAAKSLTSEALQVTAIEHRGEKT